VALADRMTLSEAIEAVGLLVRRFPNGGANAGKDYIGGLAAVLIEYPRSIALRCHDPLRGVPRETKFLPTPSDVIAWCERETDDMRRPVDREERDAGMRKHFSKLAEDEKFWSADRAARPTYDELKATHGPTWGISDTDPQNPKARENAREALHHANEMLRRRENEAAGMDPDSLVSAALVKVLREQGVAAPREAAE
jgi:hypothetical protein